MLRKGIGAAVAGGARVGFPVLWIGHDATDCNDSAAGAHPGAPEACDQLDNNCDGIVDESTANGAGSWYADVDGDGFGDVASSQRSCTQPPGFVANAMDCDDRAAVVFYGAVEVCDGLDNNCNGTTDESSAIDAGIWYADGDGDGFGIPGTSRPSCTRPTGFVADATDCNDRDSATFPGAFEICDGLDNNCNGTIDESSSIDAGIWYADGDGDGFGDGSWSQTSCTQPPGFVADATDCNDGDPSIYLFAWDDPADGVDQNCDGLDGFTDDVVCDGFTTPAEAFALFRAGPDLLDTSAVESRVATCTVTDTDVTQVRDYIIVIGDSDPCYDEGTAVGASTVSCTEASDGIYATGSGDSFDRRGSSSNWGSYGDYLWGDSTASLSFYAETPQGGSLDPHRLRYSSSESRDNYHNQFLDVSNDSSESVVEVDAILQSGASRSYRYGDSHSVHWPWGGIQIFADNSWTYESESCTLSFTRH